MISETASRTIKKGFPKMIHSRARWTTDHGRASGSGEEVETKVEPEDRGGACGSEDNSGAGSRSVQDLASSFIEVLINVPIN